MELQRLAVPLEFKFVSDNTDEMSFEGYGAVFGNVDSYGDVIAPGAFAETLSAVQKSGVWPSLLAQHGGWGMTAQDLMPIGALGDLNEDGVGLRLKAQLAPTPRGLEAHILMKMKPRPALNGLSIGYVAKEWTPRSKPEEPRRTLKKIDLYEISLVTFPANLKARVTSVKAIEALQSPAEFEHYLRDACGLSRSEATAFVSRFKAGLGPRESGEGSSDAVAAIKQLTAKLKIQL